MTVTDETKFVEVLLWKGSAFFNNVITLAMCKIHKYIKNPLKRYKMLYFMFVKIAIVIPISIRIVCIFIIYEIGIFIYEIGIFYIKRYHQSDDLLLMYQEIHQLTLCLCTIYNNMSI